MTGASCRKPGRFVFLRRLSGTVPAQAQRQYCLLESLRRLAGTGIPILGECGGFLYLQRSMTGKTASLSAGRTSAGNIPSGRTPLPFWLCNADGTAGRSWARQERKSGRMNSTMRTVRKTAVHFWHSAERKNLAGSADKGADHRRISAPVFSVKSGSAAAFADACKAYRKERLSC
ncbi:MAG: hypothetical protein ACLTXT_04605 [Ruminococcus callidus]